MLRAALSGELDGAEFRIDEVFGQRNASLLASLRLDL